MSICRARIGMLIEWAVLSLLFSPHAEATRFLLISPSVQTNGMAGAYGISKVDDPSAGLWNPAYSGYYAKRHAIGYLGARPNHVFEAAISGNYRCHSAVGGITLKKYPITIGAGLHYINDEYGQSSRRDESYNRAAVFSMGMLWAPSVEFGIGLNVKFIECRFGSDPVSSWMSSMDQATALDFGASVQAPLLKMIYGKSVCISEQIAPFFRLGYSCAVSNIADEINCFNIETALPRYCRTGINLSMGLTCEDAGFNYNLLAFDWAREVADYLVRSDYDPSRNSPVFHYESCPGDIDLFKHVLLSRSGKRLTGIKGWQITLFDVCQFRQGNCEGGELLRESYRSSGWSINLVQPLRLFIGVQKIDITSKMALTLIDHLDIEYHQFEYRPYGYYHFKDDCFTLSWSMRH